MKYTVYIDNKRHLENDGLAETLPQVVPSIEAAIYKNAFLTPTNHLFVNHRYQPAGLKNNFDDKKLSFLQRNYLYLKSRLFIKGHYLQGAYFWVHDLFSGNYYHWMCEVLPRIYWLKNKYDMGKLILPTSLHSYSFIRESLDLLGVQTVWINPNESYTVEQLITCITKPNAGYVIPDLQHSLVKALFNAANIHIGKNTSKKIYLSREKAKARKIVNEQSILPHIKKMGYEIVYAEDLSFIEQLKLFANCRTLIALHGAGHTNLMFMPSASKVLELKNPDWKSQPTCFYQLANIFEIKWDFFSASPINDELHNNSDVSVNEEQFCNKLTDFEKL